MADIYFDLQAEEPGDGSAENPYNSLSHIAGQLPDPTRTVTAMSQDMQQFCWSEITDPTPQKDKKRSRERDRT